MKTPSPHMPQKGHKQPANHPWRKPMRNRQKKKSKIEEGKLS